jgi:hypothetical protein
MIGGFSELLDGPFAPPEQDWTDDRESLERVIENVTEESRLLGNGNTPSLKVKSRVCSLTWRGHEAEVFNEFARMCAHIELKRTLENTLGNVVSVIKPHSTGATTSLD